MMTAGFSWAQAIDLGFVVFVTAACLRSLMTDTEAGERTARRWREELRALEESIRVLIEEAGTASSSLDRRLAQRKQELEQVLKKVEASSNDIAQFATEQKAQQRMVRPAEKSLELRREEEPRVPAFIDSSEPMSDLTGFYQAYQDNSVPSRPSVSAKSVARPAAKPPSKKKSLSEQLEVLRTKNEVHEDNIYRQLSITDPIAYRVARRLLEAGNEIHVVARKLDLPLAEMRLLDKLLRQDSAPADSPEKTSAMPTEVGLAVPGFRARAAESHNEFQPENFTESASQRSARRRDSVDVAIEREVALL